MPDRLLPPSKDDSQRMSERIANENIGLGFVNACAEFFQPDGGVCDDRDNSKFEKREGKGKELHAGRSHYNGAHVWGQLAGLKSGCEAVR